jgi:hypothetical protein
MPQKASTPWSVRTVAEGGTDSPVGDLVPVPDKITPVVSTGFIALSGKYTGLPADDLSFTFQDPAQALGPGAELDFAVNMQKHDAFILAVLDSSGNNINVDIYAMNPTTLSGPYTPFQDVGVNGARVWTSNRLDEHLKSILVDTSEVLAATWQFYKIVALCGTQIRLLIHNNEAANAGTISTAYLRLL